MKNAPDTSPLTRRALLAGAAATAALAATDAFGGEPAPAPAPPVRPKPTPMPSLFLGHGSPMLAVNQAKGAEFAALAKAMPRPVAVLVVSAHFQRAPITIGATTTRPLIYDFSGFPKAVYAIRYAAPGAPKLARRVARVLAPLGSVKEDPTRGHDHGTWVPIRWMYPKADVPLLSVSLPTHDARALWRMGRALRPLRDEGVLLVGSGSLTHNLRRIGRSGQQTPAWAREFDAWAADVLARNDVDALLDWTRKAPAARTNHPTVEHFVPLLLAAGARKDGDAVSFPIRGFEAATLSRRCVAFAPPAASRG